MSKNDQWFGWHRIEADGNPYMLRAWIGRLRLHVFYRGDSDPDCHDHPWDFWTFPLTPYVEEVVDGDLAFLARESTIVAGETFCILHRATTQKARTLQVVPAFWPSFRPATHCHRVLGHYAGTLDPTGNEDDEIIQIDSKKIVTIVWRSKPKRDWGFLKNREGKW